MVKINIDVAKYKTIIKYGGEKLNSYHNRAFLGVTALPLFTLYDCFTSPDKETRNNSLSKTWAKIIVGTTTGIIIRYLGFRFAKRFATPLLERLGSDAVYVKKSERRFGSLFFPKQRLGKHKISLKLQQKWLENFQKALGTYAAISAMLVTNFLVDMPLTMMLTNFLNKNVFKQNPESPKINIFDNQSVQNKIRLAFQKRLGGEK